VILDSFQGTSDHLTLLSATRADAAFALASVPQVSVLGRGEESPCRAGRLASGRRGLICPVVARSPRSRSCGFLFLLSGEAGQCTLTVIEECPTISLLWRCHAR